MYSSAKVMIIIETFSYYYCIKTADKTKVCEEPLAHHRADGSFCPERDLNPHGKGPWIQVTSKQLYHSTLTLMWVKNLATSAKCRISYIYIHVHKTWI